MNAWDKMPAEEFIIDSIFFDEYTITEAYGPITIKKIGICKIYVYGKEGKIPHFHLISNDGKFETCICINQAKYFLHGNKTDTLTKEQKEQLNIFLSKPSTKMPNATIWESIVYAWNFANENSQIDINKKLEQPNYLLMTDSIK